MAVTQNLLDLLPSLLGGAFENPFWATFLNKLRVATRADYSSLTFRPPGLPRNEVVHLYSGAAAPPRVSKLYREHLYALDPLPYHDLSEGRTYTLDEVLKRGEPDHETYIRDFLVPSGMNALRIIRVMEASGVNAWLVITRQRGEFSAADGALIVALAPYLRSALQNFVTLERERFNASITNEAIRRLAFCWFSLSPSTQVLDGDSQAMHLLKHSGILGCDARGRLTARPKQLKQEILSAVQSLSTDPASRPRAIILSQDPWQDMLLITNRKRSISAKPDPAVIAYVHSDNWSTADRCEQLAELFALLPSEARLALALSRGMTISEAALELGLTVETARNYSKKIYSKMGIRSQSELVRFVMRSVLAIT